MSKIKGTTTSSTSTNDEWLILLQLVIIITNCSKQYDTTLMTRRRATTIITTNNENRRGITGRPYSYYFSTIFIMIAIMMLMMWQWQSRLCFMMIYMMTMMMQMRMNNATKRYAYNSSTWVGAADVVAIQNNDNDKATEEANTTINQDGRVILLVITYIITIRCNWRCETYFPFCIVIVQRFKTYKWE